MAYGIQALQSPTRMPRNPAPAAKQLAASGRGGDDSVAHLTEGEMIIPESFQTPGVMALLSKEMRQKGANPAEYQVGSEHASINPTTGLQEFADRFGQARDRAEVDSFQRFMDRGVTIGRRFADWDEESGGPLPSYLGAQQNEDLNQLMVEYGLGGFEEPTIAPGALNSLRDIFQGGGTPQGDLQHAALEAARGGFQDPRGGSNVNASPLNGLGGLGGQAAGGQLQAILDTYNADQGGPRNESDIQLTDILTAYGVPGAVNTAPDYSNMGTYGEQGGERSLARFTIPGDQVLSDAEVERRGGADAISNQVAMTPSYMFYDILRGNS